MTIALAADAGFAMQLAVTLASVADHLDERAEVLVLHTGIDATLRSRVAAGLDRLDTLVDVTRRAGLPVELHVVGTEAPRPAAVDVAAYRIVQESLTNVMRHAGERARAIVTVSHGDHAVDIDVVDDGLGAAAPQVNGGHGIVGMRERAVLTGRVGSRHRGRPGSSLRSSASSAVIAAMISRWRS